MLQTSLLQKSNMTPQVSFIINVNKTAVFIKVCKADSKVTYKAAKIFSSHQGLWI